MICFLTSRTDDPETGALNTANRFTDELRRRFPDSCRALDICSNPDSWDQMDYYAGLIRESFELAGFSFSSFRTLDGRNADQAEALVLESDLLILSGGHVPTQNRFFHSIGLRGLMERYNGIVIGISAGSMNSADTVYSLPEEPGEAIDPSYERYLKGLNLTKTMLIPHYRPGEDELLDGKLIYRDLACPDSMDKFFLAIPDGSWLLVESGKETVFGEAYEIHDGTIHAYKGSIR